MNLPEGLLYTRDHEWVLFDGSSRRARIGITDFAQDALGEVVFVQQPEVGATAQLGMTLGEVESSKSVSDVYAPISGTVVEVNGDLGENPQRLNDDPYGQGWICSIDMDEQAEVDHLLDVDAYRSLVEPASR